MGFPSKRRLAFLTLRKQRDLFDKITTSIDFFNEFGSPANDVPVFPSKHKERHLFYDYINSELAHNGQIDFLEFGVHKGDSMRMWTQINTNPMSRFYGFDTFTGLPEDWRSLAKGTFDVGGSLPDLDDERVSFVKGLFQDSLRPFLDNYVPNGQLIIHIDADLYSATLYCLAMLDRFITNDTILIFDEFNDLQHEFAAFRDYTRSHYRKSEIMCRTEDYIQVAIQVQ